MDAEVARLERAPDAGDDQEMVAFQAVCERLRMHYNTGYKLKRQGKFPIPVEELGRRFYCKRVDVDAYFTPRVHRAG